MATSSRATTSTSPLTSGSELEEFGSTCGGTADPQEGLCEETNGGETRTTPAGSPRFSDGNIEDTIADTYEEAFGISEEKAECLAERITEAIEDGELNEEEAMSEIFDYLSDCDISMEEIGAAHSSRASGPSTRAVASP